MSNFTLEQLLAKQKQALSQIPRQLNKPHYIAFFGATGAAKSTLIAYMIDFFKMEFESKGRKYIIRHSNTMLMPKIGTTHHSETQIPAFYRKGGMTFLDLPGIFDNKGSLQEIINAYSNSLIFKRNISFKFVIVIEQSSIMEKRGSTFVDVISRMEILLGNNFPMIASSCCLVISKSKLRLKDDIAEQIIQIINSHDAIKPGSNKHNLIKHILENDQMLIFPNPRQITLKVITGIENKVQQLSAFRLHENTNVSLSEQTKAALSDKKARRIDTIRKNINEIASKIKQRYQMQQSNERTISNKFSSLVRAEKDKTMQKDKKSEFSLRQCLSKLFPKPLNQTEIILQMVDELHNLKVFYPKATDKIINQYDKIFEVIADCKVHLQNETQRIQNERKIQKRKQELKYQQQLFQRTFQDKLKSKQEQCKRQYEKERNNFSWMQVEYENRAQRQRKSYIAQKNRLIRQREESFQLQIKRIEKEREAERKAIEYQLEQSSRLASEAKKERARQNRYYHSQINLLTYRSRIQQEAKTQRERQISNMVEEVRSIQESLRRQESQIQRYQSQSSSSNDFCQLI